jgi:NADPH2 dehydrogenase
VHAKGSFIFLQLWALGRVADPTVLKQEGGFDVVGPSRIPLTSNKESVTPRELTVAEIEEYVQLYAKAARNAMEAGFDGVEIHGANGYLLDQFLQSESNERTDGYGGSIQNRIRFPLEAVDAVVKVVGAERTGVRISPWSDFQGKRNTRLVHREFPLTFFGTRHGYEGPSPNIYRICGAHSRHASELWTYSRHRRLAAHNWNEPR